MIIVALDNIRSAENVGSIFRTSDAFNINKIILGGITPSPANKKVLKTSLGAEKYVPFVCITNLLEEILKLKNKGFKIVSLEKTDESTDISTLLELQNICLILGNEVSGVSEEILSESDFVVHIPMHGEKESLNVSVAYGIASYILGNKPLH